jgi:hypothetical protein
MAKLTYPYIANPIAATEDREATIAYRPQRAATISMRSGRSARFMVILDTGADSCVFPLSAAAILGLDLPNLRKAYTGGVGSQTNLTYYETVTIDLGDGIAFEVEAGFTKGLDAIGLGLLGQKGFFENYNVEFRHIDKVFLIESARKSE